jgi:hypothetical protein
MRSSFGGKHFFLLAALVATLLSTSQVCNAAEPQNDCIVLTQSQSTAGSFKTTLTPHAIKMERLGSKIFLIAMAPTWRVVFYNPRNCRAIDLPLEQWLRHWECWTAFVQPFASNPKTGVVIEDYDGHRPELTGVVTYCGQKCSRYETLNMQAHETIDPRHRYAGEIYVCPIKNIPKPELQIMQKMFQIPPLEGIPVFSDRRVNGSAAHEGAGDPRGLVSLFTHQGRLSTSSFTRGRVADTDFSYPKNFKKVLKESDVMLDSFAQKEGDDTADLFGSDFKGSKGTSKSSLKR